MEKFGRQLKKAAVLLSFLALLVFADTARAAAWEGLVLCARVLVPSLFPFFVLSRLIVGLNAAAPLEKLLAPVMQALFGLPGCAGSAFVLGLVGGYPTGAQAVRNLYDAGQIDRTDARRLVLFCNNAGPAFLFGVVGSGLFGSNKAGLFLFFTHALSAVICGILLCNRRKKACNPERRLHAASTEHPDVPFSSLFVTCVQEAGAAVLRVSLFVTLFSVASGLLRALAGEALPDALFALLCGMLELSGGVAALGACALSARAALTAAAFLLAFSGLSVCAQTAAILTPQDLMPRAYIPARFLQGAIAAALTYLAAPLVSIEAEAAACGAFSAMPGLPRVLGVSWGACGMICFCCLKMRSGKRRRHRV